MLLEVGLMVAVPERPAPTVEPELDMPGVEVAELIEPEPVEPEFMAPLPDDIEVLPVADDPMLPEPLVPLVLFMLDAIGCVEVLA